MDAEIRHAMQLLQATGDFSSLCLEEFSEENLERLLRLAIIAKLKKVGAELISANNLKYQNQSGDAPRKFTETIDGKYLGIFKPETKEPAKNEPTTWESVPLQLLTHLLTINWKERPQYSFFGRSPLLHAEIFIKKVILVQRGENGMECLYRVVDLWQESPQSFEKYKIKKLKD